jgi:hypothetical protein
MLGEANRGSRVANPTFLKGLEQLKSVQNDTDKVVIKA